YGSAERAAVVAAQPLAARIAGAGEVAVHKVKIGVLGDPVEQRAAWPFHSDAIPSHVRYLQPGVAQLRGKPLDHAGQNAEAPMGAPLQSEFEQQLQSETNSQEWPARIDGLEDRLHQSPRLEFR